MRRIGSFLRDAWRIAGPYWRSEERWRARLLLGVVVALNLSLVGMSVLLSYWNREFFNSLQEKNADAFWALLFWWRQTDSGPMPGFVFVAVLYILIAVYQLYLRQAQWVARSALMNYPDIIVAEVVPGPEGAGLFLYSRSLFGWSDMGVNRKRVEAWLAALDAALRRR